MHSYSVDAWKHPHVFLGIDHAHNERRTWLVIALTAVMMVGEIIAGVAFGSMALLADGFHMATHAGALTIVAVAYLYARNHTRDERFTFGTGKIGELAGYSSAMILAIIALLIGLESLLRLSAPIPIRFNEAIVVAVLGLVVNIVCAWLLRERPHVDHDHHHGNMDGHQDHNLRAAYFHVLTDALTSVLAIAGLVAGRLYGWLWMDPLMGIVGSVVIARWSWGLLRGAGGVLLDRMPDQALGDHIRDTLGHNGDRVSDLHLWRLGPGHMAAIVSVVSDQPQNPEYYKEKLSDVRQLSHITVEVFPCQGAHDVA